MTRTPTPIAPPLQQPASPRKLTLLEAIAAASASFGDLTKDSKNDYLKSQYLALPKLLSSVKPPLLEQRVAISTQLLKVSDGSFVVRTALSLLDGSEEIFSDFPVPDPSNMHKVGAAVTYGTRYNLLALLAICPDNDDDAVGAVYGGGAPQWAPGTSGLPGLAAPPQMQQPAASVPPAMAQPVQPHNVLQ